MSKHSWRGAAALLALGLATAACTTTGVGSGLTRGGKGVNFTWTSSDSISGQMTAAVEGGKTYSGTFFQVNSETQVDRLGPLWVGWGRRFNDWPYWGYDTGPDFVRHYSGKVVANLASPDGSYLRCRFDLIRPSSGMAGGGAGRCQGPSGKSFDATFPAA
jgi:hypothetical protein